MDGITGIGVFDLPQDEWNIDVLVGGSQKALMLPPGLAFTGAGGQDRLKGKVFRIATLGYAGPYDVITAIAALEFTLKDLGYKFEMGKGVAAAVQSLADQ